MGERNVTVTSTTSADGVLVHEHSARVPLGDADYKPIEEMLTAVSQAVNLFVSAKIRDADSALDPRQAKTPRRDSAAESR